MADEIEAAKLFVIEFDHRSDGGDRIVGPFASRETAEAHVTTLSGDGFEAEYSIVSLAAIAESVEQLPDDEMPVDEPEEDEELITEIPVHGVATLEGRPTGDGRAFRPGAISFGRLPAPLGYEFESGHGSDNSRVAVIGRIDEFFTVPLAEEEGVFEVRWRGVISTEYEKSAEAISHIIDGSYQGLSVIVDWVEIDVDEERAAMRDRILADQERLEPAAEGDGEPRKMSSEEIEDLLDAFIGDGTQPTTWFKKARVRRFDMVPTGAFQEGDVWLGHEFDDELTEEALVAAAQALQDCGCLDGLDLPTVDLTGLSVEEVEAYDALTLQEQLDYALERGLVASAFAPGTKDGPGWITHPIPTARIRRYWVRGAGAAKIRWGTPGDFNRCRMQLAKYVQNPEWLAGLCANMHKEAIGVWPGQERGGRHSLVASAKPAPLFALVAAAAPVDAALFANPNLTKPTGITIDGERVYGHIAVWNACHIGMPEGPAKCTLAPRSRTNYAHFRTGTVRTTEGPIAVGQLTMNTGHADGFLSAVDTVAHYDDTGTVVADVAVGEDAVGIWYSGRIRPGVTDDDLYAFEASGRLSGDWRWIGGNYELVAALCVNVGGFNFANTSLTASAEGITAIVAAGMFDPEVDPAPQELTDARIAEVAVAAVEAFILSTERAKILEGVAPARAELKALTLAHARTKLAELVKE